MLPSGIINNYDFKVDKYVKVREVFMLYTNKGLKCLKKVDKKKESIMFMHEVKEYLVKNDFIYIDRFDLSVDGLPYVEGDNTYVVTNWIGGRECEFCNPVDLKKATETLAYFHKTMNDFKIISNNIEEKNNLGKWKEDFNKRKNELVRLKKEAKKLKFEFDRAYLEDYNYSLEMANRAISMLEKSSYVSLVKNAKYQNGFCHKDYTYHNIIMGDDNNTYIIDFDYCCFELRIYDLASFIMKNMRKTNWDVECANEILNVYNKINPLTPEEYETMKVLFVFPQKYWRVANRFYNKKHSHMDMNLYKKMREISIQKEYKHNFLVKMKII